MEPVVVVRTSDERELARIEEANVQAVIYSPPTPPPGLAGIAQAVERRDLVIERALLPRATRAELAAWLEDHVPAAGPDDEIRAALVDDILAMADRLAAVRGADRFMLRIFTEAPTTECGFHVDTVPPGAIPWGFLRVYNGAGTAFVEPDNLVGVDQFYRYLGRRERLERERREARRAGDDAAAERLEREVAELDRAPGFLADPSGIALAPAGSVVAFKHLDAGLHWGRHGKEKAWIHCSPMTGSPRLVVNLTAPDPAPRRAR
jgi:hypothetical protein